MSGLLTNRPHVHLASVGRWEVAKSPTRDADGRPVWDVTAEDLVSIVAAQDDPGVRTPIIKLGHLDTRSGIEAPAVGQIKNLSIENDGQDLYGDYVGIPVWLDEILASAYPSRSVEVAVDQTGATGYKHRAMLRAVALLGVTVPAIETLEDVAALYGADASAIAAERDAYDLIVTTTTTSTPTPTIEVHASVSVDDVRGAFYDRTPAGSWAWISEIVVAPDQYLIVNGSDEDLYRVPFTIDADETVTFGDPVRVVAQYVDAPAEVDQTLALSRYAPQDPRLSRTILASQEGHHMDTNAILARLGLPDDATDEQVEAAIAALETPAPVEPADDTPAPAATLPDGVVGVDEAVHAELVEAAREGREARQILRTRERDEYLDTAVQAGKFPPARREHYATMYDADEVGARVVIDGLATGLIPVTGDLGTGRAVEASGGGDDESLWASVVGMSGVLATPEG